MSTAVRGQDSGRGSPLRPPKQGQRHRVATTKTITIAVAGNPTSGTSALIDAIAGTRLHVGNWPGATVEKKEALFEFDGKGIKLVDLPGTYSLSPYSQEEKIRNIFDIEF